jgi:hopene-associated glycosyltransferase HpnB
MSLIAIVFGLFSLVIWLGLIFGRGYFWLAELPKPAPEPDQWRRVVALVPARDEAATVGETVRSLLAQDYPGELSVVLIDDHSSDGTADVARGAAQEAGGAGRLRVIEAPALPPGWTGKLWALQQGVGVAPDAELFLFTDADISHHPTNLRELVARLEFRERDLASLMVLLHCRSLAERFMIPAFVFFFGMLFPVIWVNHPDHRIAAAAGGCLLIRRKALERVGGLEAIRGELIDDCALARAVKSTGGALWLGLTTKTRSLRVYGSIGAIWNMIARGAYTQLRYSPSNLAFVVAFMIVTFLVPPLEFLFVGGIGGWLAVVAWILMSLAYAPMILLYGQSPAWCPLLPAAAMVYLGATVASAWRHWRGRGGLWKGRVAWRNAS